MSSTTVRFQVPYDYDIFFTRSLFDRDNDVLGSFFQRTSGNKPARCLVFIDDGVARSWPGLVEQVKSYFALYNRDVVIPAEPVVLQGGEAVKNSFNGALQVIRLARRVHLDRQSFILAIGGGAFLDVVGFAASMIHRGVRLLRVPTTVLSQNDSGIGVKNGVNLEGAKNFLGTFAPPFAVFNDAVFLDTLSPRDRVAGLAEAFKVGIIKDADFLHWLMKNAEKLAEGGSSELEESVIRCAQLHAEHIQHAGDPFEFGAARPLDFGHWSAHKLESLSMHELRHGEAVAIGMALDLLYAAQSGYVSQGEVDRAIRAMARTGLPIWHEALTLEDHHGVPLVLQGIEEFREHLGGELHITLPCPMGQKIEVNEMDRTRLIECMTELHRLAAAFATSAARHDAGPEIRESREGAEPSP